MGKAKSSYYYKSCLQICLALPLPASLKLNQHWLGTLGNLSNGICSSQSLSMMSMNRTPRLYSSTPGLSSMITAFRSRRLRNSECGSTPHLANHQTNTICLMTEWWQSSPSTLPCIAADCHPRPFLRMVLDSCADFMKSLANYTPNALPTADSVAIQNQTPPARGIGYPNHLPRWLFQGFICHVGSSNAATSVVATEEHGASLC